MADKAIELLKAMTDTAGRRAVLRPTWAPGALVFTRYQTQFNGTFDVLAGEIAVRLAR